MLVKPHKVNYNDASKCNEQYMTH